MNNDSYEKLYQFLHTFFLKEQKYQCLKALYFAKRIHNDDMRDDGTPYYTHPLMVSIHLMSLGVQEENIIIEALLHDVLEESDHDDIDLEDKFPEQVVNTIFTLSKKSGLTDVELSNYYNAISKNHDAVIVKLADRLHNLTTAYVFSKQRQKKYILETEKYIFPLCSNSNEICDFSEEEKYAINSLMRQICYYTESLKICLNE